ncbi:MAG: flagellar hook-basal body complex protein [Alphaproteobacteria bacterium]
MENAFLVSLSHLSSLKREMDVIANNLANVNTDSFKSENVLFKEFVSPGTEGEGKIPEISFVLDYGLVRNLSVGALVQTGSPLDVANSGEGYFAVQYKDQTAYTRNGNFHLSNKGELVTADGYPVLNAEMKPIIIPSGSELPDIASDGTISGPGLPNQKFGVFAFEDQQTLQKIGNNLLLTDQQSSPVAKGKITLVQGSLETSNVQPVAEITRMIEVMRKYQSASQLTENEDELTRKAIDQLSRIR